jgi:hypothetical protein
MDKNLFGCKFVTTKAQHISENKFASKVVMFQLAFELKVFLHFCYNQQTLVLWMIIPTLHNRPL